MKRSGGNSLNPIDSKLLCLEKRLGQSPEALQYIQEIKEHSLTLLRSLRLQGYNQEESMKKTLLAIEDERGLVSAYYRKQRKVFPAWKLGVGVLGALLITLQLFLIGIGGIWLNLTIGPVSTSSNTWFVLIFYLSCLAFLTPIAALLQRKYAEYSLMYSGLVLYLYTLMYISPLELFLCNTIYLLFILRRTGEVSSVWIALLIQVTYILMFIGMNEVNMSLRIKTGLYELVNYRFFMMLHMITVILPAGVALLISWLTNSLKKRAQ